MEVTTTYCNRALVLASLINHVGLRAAVHRNAKHNDMVYNDYCKQSESLNNLLAIPDRDICSYAVGA